MEQPTEIINYVPSGRIIRLNDIGTMASYLNNGRLTVLGINPQEELLVIGTMMIWDKNGEIQFNNDDMIYIRPRVSVNNDMSHIVDGDTVIVTIINAAAHNSEIIIVNLLNKQFEEYNGLDIKSYPHGIRDKTVYLNISPNPPNSLLVGYNLETGQFDSHIQITDFYDLSEGLVSRIYTGKDAILLRGQDRELKLVDVKDAEILYNIPGESINTVIKSNGVVTSFENGEKYFGEFGGTTYQIGLSDNNNGVPVKQSGVVDITDDLTNLWIKYHDNTTGAWDYVHYNLPGMRTKNARR